MQTKPTTSQTAPDEIDLITLLQNLWQGRKRILRMTLLFAFVGVAVALLSPKVYKAETRFVPQTGAVPLDSNLSGLAALAGVPIHNEATAQIPATLYPTVSQSTPYLLTLLQTPLKLADGDTLSLKAYLMRYPQSSVMDKIQGVTLRPLLSWFKKKPKKSPGELQQGEYYSFSEEMQGLLGAVQGMLEVAYTLEDGTVALSVSMPHPEAAAQVAAKATDLLQQTIIDFRIQNAQKVLEYVNEQYKIKEKEFLNAQQALAAFKDSHQNIGTAVFENKRAQLENRYHLRFSLYRELALQREQAELQVNKDTPIFSVLEPVVQPHHRDRPKRKLIVLLSAFLGFVAGCGWVLAGPAFKNLKRAIVNP